MTLGFDQGDIDSRFNKKINILFAEPDGLLSMIEGLSSCYLDHLYGLDFASSGGASFFS